MTKTDLIKALEQYPDSMDVWLVGPKDTDEAVQVLAVGSGIPSELRKKGQTKKVVVLIQS